MQLRLTPHHLVQLPRGFEYQLKDFVFSLWFCLSIHFYHQLKELNIMSRIGILGGMGPAATADFLTKLVQLTPASYDY